VGLCADEGRQDSGGNSRTEDRVGATQGRRRSILCDCDVSPGFCLCQAEQSKRRARGSERNCQNAGTRAATGAGVVGESERRTGEEQVMLLRTGSARPTRAGQPQSTDAVISDVQVLAEQVHDLQTSLPVLMEKLQ